MLRTATPLRVPKRVRELYLEFMLLHAELDGIRSSGGLVDRAKHKKPFFYLRLEYDQTRNEAGGQEGAAGPSLTDVGKAVLQAVDGVLLSGPLSSSPETSGDATSRQRQRHHQYGCTYRVNAADCPQLDAFLPKNWRESDAACVEKESSESLPSSSSASPPVHVPFTAHYRAEVQQAFYECALLAVGGNEWKRSLARGRLELRKLHELLHMKKYRAMRKRYDWAAQLTTDDLLAAIDAGAGTRDEKGTMERLREAQMGLGNRDTYGYKAE